VEEAGRELPVRVGDDGTVLVSGFALPPSPAWSTQARKVFLKRFTSPPVRGLEPAEDPGRSAEERWLAAQGRYRTGMEQLHERLVARLRRRHDVQIEESLIGGVRTQVVNPSGGVRDPSRVLVNLHGGAFVGGAEYCGLVESIPIATTGGWKVIVVDYRQGWEHRFPAASEDVSAVYRELLETYDSGHVGLFGYSAGASLVAQSIAWFGAHDLPVPGAAAMCSGGAGQGFVGGDAAYLGTIAMGDPAPSERGAEVDSIGRFGYFAGTDLNDPLISPGAYPDVLALFPPTLLLSGTRSFDLSDASRTHRGLLNAGTASELHVWEGMWHCFAYHDDMPESQDAYRTINGFFGRALA
jgi:monoterpene epsilon-lactone hydrolase